MLQAGAAPGSVRIRQLAVRRFVAWLIATGHLPVDPFAGVKGARQTRKLVTPLTDDDLRALIATCVTPTHRVGEPLPDRRRGPARAWGVRPRQVPQRPCPGHPQGLARQLVQ